MKLVIIGNGFDLHHGLKTSFEDFKGYLKQFEDKKDLCEKIDRIMVKNKGRVVNINESEAMEISWNMIEEIFYNEFMNVVNNGTAEIEKFETIVESFVYEFYLYLKQETEGKTIKIDEIIRNQVNDAAVLLAFNYTKTYMPYINNKFVEVFHIHGTLEQENYPLIGYWTKTPINQRTNADYYAMFQNIIIDKGAMAYKQNRRLLQDDIDAFRSKYKDSINEIVNIGYSFGNSDSHIYEILNDILITQNHTRNMPYQDAAEVKKIKFIQMNYNDEQSHIIVKSIINNLEKRFHRNAEVRTFGNGIVSGREKLIQFELVNY